MSTIKTNQLAHTANGASVFTLPQTDGSSGQVLKTDASGGLSFTTGGKTLQVVQDTMTATGSFGINNTISVSYTHLTLPTICSV